MPVYSYIAQSVKEGQKSGAIEAKDKNELNKILRQKGYFLISADIKDKKRKKGILKYEITIIKTVSLTEKMMFTRNLRIMLVAGVSLSRSLTILAKQAKSKILKRALFDIEGEVAGGKTFSNALSKHTNVFSEIFVNMVKTGEESGTLGEVLRVLALQMEREHELISRVKGAMMYPAVILTAMLGIGALMFVVVVPKLAKTFEELGVDLPIMTRIVIGFGDFLIAKWYLGILIIIILIFSFKAILKTRGGKKAVAFFILKVPVISSVIKKTETARSARTLGSLIVSGVSIVRGLEVTSRALGNIYFKEAMIETANRVKEGAKLSEALASYQNLYSPIMIQMIEVGEESGQTSEILIKLAEFYEEEVNNVTRNFSAIIEPVLMLIIGAAVGFFAIAMFKPMVAIVEVM